MRLQRLLSTLRLRLRSVFRRARVEEELDEEIRDHIDRRVAADVARGVPREQAYRAALRGNPCELAAAIAHERIHVREGRYQAPAYAEQLRVLRACGAKTGTIARVAEAAARFVRDVPPKADSKR